MGGQQQYQGVGAWDGGGRGTNFTSMKLYKDEGGGVYTGGGG